MTTAVIIGYVSLFAVAIQTGIIMIEFIREALAHRTAAQSYMEAVVEGSVARLRPKLMTVATTVLGLLPIMFATGSGMDITKPIATPTFGGMITLDDLRAVPDSVPVRDRRRHPSPLAGTVPCAGGAGRTIAVIRALHSVWGRALVSCLVLLGSACANDGGRSQAQENEQVVAPSGAADGFVVTFGTEPAPPMKGGNQVLVTVKRPDGTPVTDVTVTTVLSMAAMPSMNMPAMRTEASLDALRRRQVSWCEPALHGRDLERRDFGPPGCHRARLSSYERRRQE